MLREARAIVTAATTLREHRTPFLVATVVSVHGSSYRQPGARLLATAEGRVAGNISGGCLEKDLIRSGFWRTRSGPVLVRYDSTDPQGSEISLGCGGIVEVLLEQASGRDEDDDPLAFIREALTSERPAILVTVFRSTDPSVPIGTRWCKQDEQLFPSSTKQAETQEAHDIAECIFSTWPVAPGDVHAASRRLETAAGVIELLIEPIVPPPHLFVLGTGLDAVPLVGVARQLGWSITMWNPSHSFSSRATFEGTGAQIVSDLDVVRARIDASDRAMVVVMGHHLANDRAALSTAIASRAQYIGVLGPRHRTVSLAAELPGMLDDPRVHAPVGLDLGAETPDEIALAIAAEMLASLHRTSAAPLRQRRTIHVTSE